MVVHVLSDPFVPHVDKAPDVACVLRDQLLSVSLQTFILARGISSERSELEMFSSRQDCSVLRTRTARVSPKQEWDMSY